MQGKLFHVYRIEGYSPTVVVDYSLGCCPPAHRRYVMNMPFNTSFITRCEFLLPQEVISSWDAGIGALVEAGVTGRILLGNVASPKGLFVSMSCFL